MKNRVEEDGRVKDCQDDDATEALITLPSSVVSTHGEAVDMR